VEAHPYVPHDEIMPSASLVIGHGGHSTTMRSLAHGVPLLIPPMHRILDQPMIGKALAAAGAARVLPVDCFRRGDPTRGRIALARPIVPTSCGSRRRPLTFRTTCDRGCRRARGPAQGSRVGTTGGVMMP
jgi:hypothetical protein